jgi:hypothetical protein
VNAGTVVVEGTGAVVVATRVVDVVVVIVDAIVVDDRARGRTVLSVPDEPHAAVVSVAMTTNARATR